jgi:hypothetical protein
MPLGSQQVRTVSCRNAEACGSRGSAKSPGCCFSPYTRTWLDESFSLDQTKEHLRLYDLGFHFLEMSSHVDFKRSNTERLSSRLHDYWAGRTLSDIPSTAEEHGSHTADYWDGDQAGKNAKVFLAADYTGAGESSYSPGSNVHSYWNGLSTDKDLTDVYLKKRRNTTAFLQGLATGCNGPSALVLGELASTICWQLKAGEGDPTATLVWLGSQILSQIAVKLSIKSKDAIQKAFATTYRCLLARVPGTGAHVHTEPLCWVPTVYAQCTEDLAGRANALSLSRELGERFMNRSAVFRGFQAPQELVHVRSFKRGGRASSFTFT